MHSRHLVQLAAWLASHGTAIIRSPGQLSTNGLQQYWAAAKCRHDRWIRAFKLGVESKDGMRPIGALELRALAEEILTGEMLARIWGAVLTTYDRRRKTREYEPIAASVLDGQFDARQRVLQLIAHSPNLDLEGAVQLNRLRRRCERWTDLLLGNLLVADDVREFAIEPDRAVEFSISFREQQGAGRPSIWPVLLGSLESAFEAFLLPSSPNPDLNERIAAGILGSFPGECFDTFGLLPSLWLVRMSHCANDAEGMIDELLAIEGAIANSSALAGSRLGEPLAARRFDGPTKPWPHVTDD